MRPCGVVVTGMSWVLGNKEDTSVWHPRSWPRKRSSSCISSQRFFFDPRKAGLRSLELFRIEKILAYTLRQALRDARIRISSANAHRCAIVLANTYGVEEFRTQSFRAFDRGEMAKISLTPYSSASVLATQMSTLFRIHGPSVTLSSGSVSGAEAIIAGANLIHSGQADIVIVAGVNFFCKEFGSAFDQSGFRQEGCAALILESARHASLGGRRTYGRLDGFQHGFCSSGRQKGFERIAREFFAAKEKHPQKAAVVSRGCRLGSRYSYVDHLRENAANKKKTIVLESLVGNTFCSSGVLGVILCNLIVCDRLSEVDQQYLISGADKIRQCLFLSQDVDGCYAAMIVSA